MMKSPIVATIAAAICTLAFTGVSQAQSAEYVEARLKKIEANISQFEEKMADMGCETTDNAETLAKCDRLQGKIEKNQARREMYAGDLRDDYSERTTSRLIQKRAELEAQISKLQARIEKQLAADDVNADKVESLERRVAKREAKLDHVNEKLRLLADGS